MSAPDLLYHFTSPHHVGGCLAQGLRLGMVPQATRPPKVLPGYQWLTTNRDRRQSWTEGSSLPYDRTAYMLTVRIPKEERHHLLRWTSVGPLLAPPQMVRTLNAYGDPENWWLFDGVVLPEWIVLAERTTDAVPKIRHGAA